MRTVVGLGLNKTKKQGFFLTALSFFSFCITEKFINPYENYNEKIKTIPAPNFYYKFYLYIVILARSNLNFENFNWSETCLIVEECYVLD